MPCCSHRQGLLLAAPGAARGDAGAGSSDAGVDGDAGVYPPARLHPSVRFHHRRRVDRVAAALATTPALVTVQQAPLAVSAAAAALHDGMASGAGVGPAYPDGAARAGAACTTLALTDGALAAPTPPCTTLAGFTPSAIVPYARRALP